MNHRTIILALSGLVLLLAGLIIGQNLERSRAADARLQSQPAAQTAPGPAGAAQPAAPLSTTEYWISTPQMDATRTGFCSWAVLRPGGNFVLERCRAPDYTIPDEPGAPLEFPTARCESMVDGLIVQLGEKQLMVRPREGPPRTFGFSLAREGAKESLVLDVGKKVELVRGSKNSLVERLDRLPSDEEARKRYLQRMLVTGVAVPSGAAPQSSPAHRVP